MGTILKALKIRIYPTQKQEELILQTIGSCRFLYNNMLAERIQNYESWKTSGQDRKVLYESKFKTEK